MNTSHMCPRCKEAKPYPGRVCAFRADGTFTSAHQYCMSMAILREMGEDFLVEEAFDDCSQQYCATFPVGGGKYIVLGFYSSKPTETALIMDAEIFRQLRLEDLDPAISYIEKFWANCKAQAELLTPPHPGVVTQGTP